MNYWVLGEGHHTLLDSWLFFLRDSCRTRTDRPLSTVSFTTCSKECEERAPGNLGTRALSCLLWDALLASWGCHNKVPLSVVLCHVSQVWRTEVWDQDVRQGWFLLSAERETVPGLSPSFWWLLAVWCSLASRTITCISALMLTRHSPCVHLSPNLPSLQWHHTHWIRVCSTPVVLPLNSYICKDPIIKYGHILRQCELEFQQLNVGRAQFNS